MTDRLFYVERWQPVEKNWLPYLVFDDYYKCLSAYEHLCHISHEDEYRMEVENLNV